MWCVQSLRSYKIFAKITLSARINVFNAFLCKYMESSVFLEVSRRGCYRPLSPIYATVIIV